MTRPHFIVYGDILINSGTVSIEGKRPISLIATNNATIGSGVIFDVSAGASYGRAGGWSGRSGLQYAYNGRCGCQ
jgi:hypothetical protein